MSNVIYFLAAAATNPNSLLTNVLLPFLLIFVVLWGILNVIKIFGSEGRKINIVVALVITIFAAFTDVWGLIVTQLAAFTGIFTYVVFIGVFILGVIFWAIGRGREGYSVAKGGLSRYDTIKDIDKRLGKLYKKMEEERYKGNADMAASLGKEIEKLEDKRDAIYRVATQEK